MITPLNAPRDFGSPFHSQGVLVTGVDGFVVVSGQVGVRPDGTVGRGVGEQTTIAMENVRAVLAEADLDLTAVITFTIHLTDDAHIADFVEHASTFLHPDPSRRPAATLLIQDRLANPDLLVQIEAMAAVQRGDVDRGIGGR